MADVNRGNRPLSPHLTIYRPQLTSVTSILTRITGNALLISALLVVWWFLAAAFYGEKYAWLTTVNGLMRTTDAGSTWDLIDDPDSLYGWRSMDFLNPQEGWISMNHSSALAHTVDSGFSWQVTPSPIDKPIKLRFYGDSLGVVMNDYREWARTLDQGKTWEQMPDLPFLPRPRARPRPRPRAWLLPAEPF